MVIEQRHNEQRPNPLAARERVLAEGVRPVADELRLVDLADFVSYIRNEQFANLEDILNSSVELYFKPGTLTFGWAADLAVDWDRPPRIMLDMEFRHLSVLVFFGLSIEPEDATVEIRFISFENAAEDPQENTRRLIEALLEARMPPAAG
jgi:hypothetical protein